MFISGYIPVFKQLIDAFDAVIRFFHDTFGFGWGLSIIALTVCVRAVLVPLTLKQFKSMQSLQRLAPEIKKLQEKYKDDKQRLNQEMMKFYQENKVNPFGSCLPLLMQMPVFISLFYMLRKDLKIDICGPKERILEAAQQSHTTLQNIGCDKVDPGSAKFLFIGDLTHSATGATLIVLLALYVGSQLASSLLMSVTADKNQRTMMLALPFVFVLFVRTFPAGLLVYWITTNLWTVGQQYLVRRTVGHIGPPPDTGAKDSDAKPKPPADGGEKKPRAGRRRREQRQWRAPAAPAAQEEEALGAAALMAATPAAEALNDLLEKLVDALGLTAEVSVSDDGELVRGSLAGEDLGLFIGRHGQTIDAVQHLAMRVVASAAGERRLVEVDAEGYRERRAEVLRGQADDAADEALRFGRAVSLDAMGASERKLVHEYLRDRGDVETYSEGDEPHRHLVVAALRSS